MLSTLIPIGITALVFTILFLFFRRFEKHQYSPRSYLRTVPEHRRTPTLPNGWFNWIKPFWAMPDVFILQRNSLDAYFFVRFLKISTIIAFVGACITIPILFPVNATGGAGNQQLDILSFSNIVNPLRFYAHTFVSWIFFGFVLVMISRETIYYVNMRQAYLLSPLYATRLSQRTVLFASVPAPYLQESKIRSLFGDDVDHVWINGNTKELDELVEQRDKIAYNLEGAETKLIVLANKNHDEAVAKAAKGKGEAPPEAASTGNEGDDASGSIAQTWVPEKKRPTHRTKFLIGTKVDTINWSRAELEKIIPQVTAQQDLHKNAEGELLPAVFVAFKTQAAAQAAAQSVTHHLALHMAPRWAGVTPEEIVWKNLRIKWWERKIREMLVMTFIVLLIIFWSIPVAIIGLISNINYLTDKVHFLRFINHIPHPILGIVTALLPTVMLAVLMALVPIIMRIVSKLAGAPTLSVVELKTQNYYFAFQAVQGFIVTTLASAASAAVTQIIQQPGTAISLLSTNLPKASNFYISYIIVQGLTLSSGAILQIAGLVVGKLLGRFLDNTPRKVYKRWAELADLGWGTLYPAFTLLTVIALTYAIIAPLVLVFATVGLSLVYIAFRYNFLFTSQSKIDTKGIAYSQALQHLMVGLYLAEVCLIGLFAINKAAGPIVLEVIFLVFTILFHLRMNAAMKPLQEYLPKDLISEEAILAALEDARHPQADATNGHGDVKEVDTKETDATATSLTPAPTTKKPSFFMKWLRPDKYCDYQTLRRLIPDNYPEYIYTPEELRTAYLNPSVSSPTPLLWIPKDKLGVSEQEVRHTAKVIHITNETAFLDDKNKVKWDEETDPPIYEETKTW
jgi:hypothetical protein